MASTLNNGIQGLTQVCLKAISSLGSAYDRILVLPSPSKGKFSNGIKEQEILAANQIGELVLADTFVTQREGTLSLTYASKTKELLSVFFGLALANGTKTTAVAKTIQVSATSYAPSPIGYDGNGMLPDQATSFASYLTPLGVSVTLTQSTFAGHNIAVDNTWAQGTDGAFKFSTNLLTSKAWVTIYAPYDSANTDYLSATPQVSYKGDLLGVMINKQVFHLKFDNLIANLTENKEFEFGGGEIDLNFRIGLSGSGCKTFDLLFPNLIRTC